MARLRTHGRRHKALTQLDKLTQNISNIKGVGSITSVTDFIKISNKKRIIPNEKKSLSEMFLIYGMAEENPLDNYLSPNYSQTRLGIRMIDLESNHMLQQVDEIEKMVRQSFPNMQITLAGPAMNIHIINREVSKRLIMGFFEALLLIIILLAFVFRSLSWALLSALPNFVPPSFLMGALTLSQIAVKPGIAIIFAISLGIAFDNTVYLLSKLKSKKQSHGEVTQKDIFECFASEAKACLLSSLCLMVGFSAFIMSQFNMNILFGLFMVISVTAGLIGDLVLLPALIYRFPTLLNRDITHGIIKFMKNRIKNKSSKLSSFLIIALSIATYSKTSEAKITADEILNKVQASGNTANETAELFMVIKERDGSKKERQLTIKKKNGKEQKALVKITKPSDLKGVGLLSISSKGEDSQWLYLPSEKRSRRLSGSGKKGKFLDSDLTYEDLSISTYKNFNNKIDKIIKDKNTAVIVSNVKKKSASSYSRIKTWVDLKTHQIKKASYYNHKKKLAKKMLFNKYKKVGGTLACS